MEHFSPQGLAGVVHLPATLREVKERSVKGASLSVGAWGEDFFTGNSESYVRHVKEGSGNETPLS